MLWQLTALEAAARIRGGAISSEDLVRSCLERISETDDTIRAWHHLDADRALEQAREMDLLRQKGRPLGPLHGVPVGVKDIFDTADMPTECGTSIHQGRRPDQDATAVARLREAGAVIMGKTETTELAFVHPTVTTNPHDSERTPGGSSSGSAAAVAAGHVPIAIGTQTNGSVIRPASFCGIYGFKPTRGLISRRDVLQTSKTLDQVGVFARVLGDAAAATDALKGYDREDDATHARPKPAMLEGAMSLPPVEPSFAVFEGLPYAGRLAEAVVEGLAELTESLGARAEIIPAPDSFADAIAAHQVVHEYEFLHHLADVIEAHWDALSGSLRPILEHARTLSDEQYQHALRMVAGAEDYFSAFFMDYDAVLTPAALGEAPAIAAGGTGDPVCCTLWTLAGLPCLTLPLMVGAAGLPVGVQMVGSQEEDGRLLACANWLQQHLQDGSQTEIGSSPEQQEGEKA